MFAPDIALAHDVVHAFVQQCDAFRVHVDSEIVQVTVCYQDGTRDHYRFAGIVQDNARFVDRDDSLTWVDVPLF